MDIITLALAKKYTDSKVLEGAGIDVDKLKEEIIEEVLNRLPNGDEVSY